MKQRLIRRLLILTLTLITTVTVLLSPAPAQRSGDICKGGGIAWQTCSAWQDDLVNACFVNFPNGGPGYQKCLDDSWDSYVACMGMFGCPVKPRIVNP